MYTIRFLFLLTFVVSIMVAIFTSGNRLLSETLRMALLINGLGILIAVVVTYVLRFPRDGSYRGKYEEPGDGGDDGEADSDGLG